MLKMIGALLMMLQMTATFARANPPCSGKPHTVHSISTNKSATCVLSQLYETEKFCLIDANGNEMAGQEFRVDPQNPVTFGMIYFWGADFNMEYALTCVSDKDGFWRRPKVIFNIGASGPADPAVSTIALYGAQGSWTSTHTGENYSITF